MNRTNVRFVIAIGTVVFGASVAQATTAFNLGSAANFGIVMGTDNGSTTNSLTINGAATITGAVGIESGGYFKQTAGSIAGVVDFSDAVSDSGYTNGTAITSGQSFSGSNNTVSGSSDNQGLYGGWSSQLSSAATSISALQTTATNSISGGTTITSLNTCNSNVTLTAGAGVTTVWNSAGINLGPNCKVTISGSSTSLVIINVTSGSFVANDTIAGGGITLSGGITSQQILWNITGSGSNFSANGTTANNVLTGIFLDTAGSYSLQNVTVNGWLYGANSTGGTPASLVDTIGAGVTVTAGSNALPEPSTWMMAMVFPVLLGARKLKAVLTPRTEK